MGIYLCEYSLTLLLIFATAITFAQDRAVFRIITLSYGVNIDGDAISVGQHIKENSKNISIPKGGYLGVLNSDGEVG